MSCFGGSSVSLEAKRTVLEDNTPLGAYLTSKEVRTQHASRTQPCGNSRSQLTLTRGSTPVRQLGELAKICSSAKVSVGKLLPESPFYVIISGQVEVREGTSNDVLCTKSAGAFFTRRAGLVAQQQTRGTRRSAMSRTTSPSTDIESRSSIVAAKDADEEADDSTPLTDMVGKSSGKVLWVHTDKLLIFLENVVSRESRDIINAITRTNIGTQLSQVPFIEQAGLDAPALRSLGEICSYACYQEGKTVFQQGGAYPKHSSRLESQTSQLHLLSRAHAYTLPYLRSSFELTAVSSCSHSRAPDAAPCCHRRLCGKLLHHTQGCCERDH